MECPDLSSEAGDKISEGDEDTEDKDRGLGEVSINLSFSPSFSFSPPSALDLLEGDEVVGYICPDISAEISFVESFSDVINY